MTRRRFARAWLVAAAVAWAATLFGAALYAVDHRRPTAIEQTTIAQAVPAVDRALATLVTAAAGPRAVVGIGGYVRTQADCDAGHRSGERYERAVLVYVEPGQEPAVVDRIAGALPGSSDVAVRHAGAVHGLRADVGFYVILTGGLTRPGELRFTADTGCRRRGGDIPAGAVDGGSEPVRAGALEPLRRLGGTQHRQRVYQVACPSGGTVSTVAVSGPKPPRPVSDARPDGATAVVDREDLLAYRAGEVSVAVALNGDELIITATAGCQ